MFENSPVKIDIEYSQPPEPTTDGPIDLPAEQSPTQAIDPQADRTEPPLYFLSVNYYSAALISDLMHTLETNQGIVIVNNSPADQAIHQLAGQRYGGSEVTVIDAPDNGGFGAGCNLGLQWIYARSPHALVWLINPDAALVSGAIANLRSCLNRAPNTAILGTPILDSQGRLWFGSGQFNPYTGSITSHVGLRAQGTVVPTRWVSGCSMILNLAILGHCPQFDEAYFLYYEDCDLCERYFQQGYEIALTPMPLVIHAVSSITSRYVQAKFVHGTFSKLTFLRRHGTWLALVLNLLYLATRALSETFRQPLAAKGRWQGIYQFLRRPNAKPQAASLADTLQNDSANSNANTAER